MPRINRIRIANVPYSGRHIVDQLINCYGGENVLLNLSNGGGKSVLTQLIMQPIIPNVKIHKRKVESYLQSKEPTFVMIEWILDNTPSPTYFLTGIVMNRAISEENKYRVKFFTFVNQYKSADQYDIKNIDFITNEDGVTKYKSYDYCLTSLRKKEGSTSQIETFTIDEQKRYHQVLEERGIFKEEWKILAKINEKEGGVDDIFEKCEKSDDVIDQWILKTISEKLENAEDLREMFLNLMEDVMKHEDEIKQKEELEAFQKEADQYIQELAELLENMDKQESIKRELEEIFLKLSTCVNKLEQKENELKAKINEKSSELDKIEYEELSEEYYRLESELEEKEEQYNEKTENLQKVDEKLNEAKTILKIIKAAKLYEEYKEAKAEREAAFIAKKRLEEGMKEENIRDIEYSLKLEYKKQIDKLLQEINRTSEELENTRIRQKEINEQEEVIYKKNTEIQKNIFGNSYKIDYFKKYEIEILKELEIKLTRNILEELDEKEIEDIFAEYRKRQEDIQLQIIQNEQLIKDNEEKIKKNNVEIQDIDKKVEQTICEIKDEEKEIENYQKQTKELKDILDHFAIDKQKLFDKQTNLIEIERKRDFVSKRKNENTEQLNQSKELLYSLKNGGIHVDLKIGKILEKNKIDYQTGEEYLTGQPYTYQQKLLQMNPMLPYSYIILKDKDYEKVEELIINEEINRITPIILQKEIEKDFKAKNKVISVVDNIKFECLYNTKAFDEKLKKKFEEELLEQIEYLEKKIKEDDDSLIYIQKSLEFIKEYKYDINDEKLLNEKLKRSERTRGKFKTKKKSN